MMALVNNEALIQALHVNLISTKKPVVEVVEL